MIYKEKEQWTIKSQLGSVLHRLMPGRFDGKHLHLLKSHTRVSKTHQKAPSGQGIAMEI